MERQKTGFARIRVPQQDRAKKKARKIIEAAHTCFNTLGYEKTTMTRIAKNAGVSTGTAYAYYADKDHILKEVLTKHVEDIVTPLEEYISSMPDSADLKDVLRDLIGFTVKAHNTDPGIHKVFLSRIMKDPGLHLTANQFRERGLKLARILVKRFGGSMAQKDIEATVQVVSGLVEFSTHIGLLYPSNVDNTRACTVAIDMIQAYFTQEIT
jgi:AcrR family transcriptional regulator